MATKKPRKSKQPDVTVDTDIQPTKSLENVNTNAKGKGKKGRANTMVETLKANQLPVTPRSSTTTIGKTRKSKSNLDKATKQMDTPEDRSMKSTELGMSDVDFWSPYEWEDMSEVISIDRVEPVISRTTCLVIDYKRFKAARVIQTAARAWYARHMLQKKKRAAIVIQQAWRKFYDFNKEFNDLEQRVQDTLWAHYHRSATLVQSLWRGWWVRQHIHDQYRLKRMQLRTAQELLHCVAFKLHHLLRTRQIPGVYSLRNSHCLSQVEKLLASMTFKQHNAVVRLAKAKRERLIGDAKKKFCDSVFGTEVPYAGPNFRGICDPQCVALYNEVDADRKMHEILSIYERKQNEDPRIHKLQRSKDRKADDGKGKLRRKKRKSPNFCDDVIESMRHWQIIDRNKLTVASDIFKTPANVENFLREVQSIFSMMNLPCHCNTKINELAECHKI